MPATVVIPARFSSTRFPGKPLVSILGRPMVEHVYRRAEAARKASSVWVATDDERIARAVQEFGGKVVMTSKSHPTGTHRVLEAAKLVGGDLVVNLQADEPLIAPEQIDAVIDALEKDPHADLATLCRWTWDQDEIEDPNCVKVVMDHKWMALYFSRSPIPHLRAEKAQGHRSSQPLRRGAWIHIGLYAYCRRAMEVIPLLPPCPWEDAEGLEQLRFLHWGLRIKVAPSNIRTIGVDVPEDVPKVERLLKEGK
jgi:3-deoxy-manno-octulosonate cytidylyltransferase (CMP-KDO synthetase)